MKLRTCPKFSGAIVFRSPVSIPSDTDAEATNLGASVFAGNGDGTFQTAVTFPAGTMPVQVLPVDINADKAPDLVVVNFGDNTISVLLNTVGTDFSISASAASPGTISPGQSSTSTMSLRLLNAFDNPVSLTCSVQPAQAGSPSCSLSPSTVTFDANGNGSAQLTINAGTSSASLTAPRSLRILNGCCSGFRSQG